MMKYYVYIDKLILQDTTYDYWLQRLLREVECNTLNFALIGADNKTVEKCCRNMSVRRVCKLKETLVPSHL